MIAQALKRVFEQRAYRIIASGIAFSVLVFFLYFPNLKLISAVIFSGGTGFVSKINFLASLAGSFYTNNTFISASLLLGIAVLMSINIAMLVFVMKKNKRGLNKKENAATFGGVIGGALGVGCAACGSLVLTPILLALGATGFLSLLPLHGGEFGLLGALLLWLSIRMLARKINDPLICPVD